MKDLSGQKFGKLTVIKREQNLITPCGNKIVVYLCQCECGNTKTIRANDLRSGKIVSCGCYRLQRLSEKISKHNKTNTPLYRTWSNMKTRCYNPKFKQFKDYGGKGVIVYKEWLRNFQSFYDWAVNNGYKEGLSIDRINVNGNYEPNNCRWVSNIVQQRNKNNNKTITHNGETHCLTEWGEILGINLKTLYSRIYSRKWSIEKALEFK